MDSWVGIKKGGENAGLDLKTAWLVQGGVGNAARGVASNSLSDASWTELRILFAGDSRVVAQGSHGGLLEEASEPKDEETRRPKSWQGNRRPRIKATIFIVNVLYRYIL